uniref:DUF262 domain-containing protein n=1 Tax=uncultured marine group II/III euryarchaeote AD1000_65_H04 TaxID=1457796 RepID=A0A075FVN0_9EURY|nr:hypothetical protein [uncultured marine group II/III euryarchaeote AD1000_65_H04]
MPKDYSLEKLFNSDEIGKRITIPAYQRNFSWKKPQITAMMKDILKDTTYRRNEKSSYGIVIGCKNQDNGNFEIVDGQQRLATFQLILFCLHRRALLKFVSNTTNSDSHRLSIKIEDLLGENTPKFVFNHDDRETWTNYYSKKAQTIENGDTCDTRAFIEITAKPKRERNNIEEGLLTVDTFLTEYFENGGDWISKLFTWMRGKTNLGLRVSIQNEVNPVRAIERFDRENNRGLSIRLDDLVRSYLIEAINSNQTYTKNQKNAATKKVVEHWSLLHKKTQGLKKEIFIKWVVENKLSKYDLKEHAEHYRLNLIQENANEEPNWGATEVANEIGKWAETYEKLTSSTDLVGPDTGRLKYFKECNLITVWGFLIPLRMRIEEENYTGSELGEGSKLPKEILGLVEYIVIGKQLFGDFRPQYWERYFRVWRAVLGNKDIPLSTIINNIKKSLRGEVLGSSRNSKGLINIEDFKKPREFIDEYNLYVRDKLGEVATLSSKKRRTHTRMLVMAEEAVTTDRTSIIRDVSINQNNLEHILPSSSSPWSKSDNPNSVDPSLMEQIDLDEVCKYKQHIGNHTLLWFETNFKLKNYSFYDKKYGPNIRSVLQLAPNRRPCYQNSKLSITKSLMNHNPQFTSNNLLARGRAIINAWMSQCLNDDEIDYNFDELEYDSVRETNDEILAAEPEGNKLEHKEVIWRSNSDGMPNLRDQVKPEEICKTVNAFLNSDGGTILIGVQDNVNRAFEIVGIDSTIDYVADNECGGNKRRAIDQVKTKLTEIIKLSIPSDYHGRALPKFRIMETQLSNTKYVLKVNVEAMPEDIKPIPYQRQNVRSSYYVRISSRNDRIPLELSLTDIRRDKRGNLLMNNEIFPLNSDLNGDTANKAIGPFKNEKQTIAYKKALKEAYSIESDNPKFIKFETALGSQVKDCLSSTGNLSTWKAKDKNGDQSKVSAWIFNVKDVPVSWAIPTKEDWSRVEHIVENAKCPKCGAESKTKAGITKKFGGFTPTRPPKFIQSHCKSCRRG